jgi:hypothetical protein
MSSAAIAASDAMSISIAASERTVTGQFKRPYRKELPIATTTREELPVPRRGEQVAISNAPKPAFFIGKKNRDSLATGNAGRGS